ncbi:MAG: hypothetical protein J6M44_13345 [Butyrivibrio sp.]|nr:hypothetical protein [Butyrivibrio sp.]
MLSKEIESIMADKEVLSDYAKRAYERAGLFSPEQYKENLIRIFESL